MAEVILAAQQGLAGFERLVVIKRVSARLRSDRRFVQMFLDEARLAARLRHPHVVTIHDVQRDDDSYAVVMEYLSGEDLGYVLGALGAAERRIPVGCACRIAADIADGLHAAHSAADIDGSPRPIVHRDVSPSNIVVTYDGSSKLVDFGVAKADENHTHTQPGTLKGKLPYVSPEQVQGQEVDARSDLFSLGAVLHEMLTSRKLFSGPSQAAILRNIMERRIPPPSVYNPKVPPILDDLVLAMLERDPGKRTPSAAALRDRLEALLETAGNVTHRRLGDWLRTSLAERYRRRQEVEREMVEQARAARGPVAPGAELRPLFDDGTPFSATPTPASPATLPPMVASTGVAPMPVSAASTPTGGGAVVPARWPKSTTGELAPASPVAPEPAPRSRARMWVVLGTVAGVTLVALGAAVGALVIDRRGSDPGEAAVAVAPPAAARPQAVSAEALAADTDVVGLLIYAVPSGVAVNIDGEPLSQRVGPDGLLTPVPRDATVRVELSKDGYVSRVVELRTPSAGTAPMYVNLSREGAGQEAVLERRDQRSNERRDRARPAAEPTATAPAAAELLVTASPADARLVVDGEALDGRSPHRLALAEGPHTVQVEADGFEGVHKAFELRAGSTYELNVQLSRAVPPRGTVHIESVPAGAAVLIDGRAHGTTPIAGLLLPADEPVEVQLERDGFETWSRQVVPRAGRERTLQATLMRSAPPPPVVAPLPPSRSTKPRLVPPASVDKVRGSLPVLRVRSRDLPPAGRVTAKLCIDTAGAVTSAQILGDLSGSIARELREALSTWRYRPYRDGDAALPVCFAVTFNLEASEP